MSHIVIADGHALCREALCEFIRHGGEEYSVASFGVFEELKSHMAKFKPDLILVSPDFPGMESLEELSAGRIGILIRHGEEKPEIENDIAGVFPKSLPCKTFMIGIGKILAGGSFFPAIDMPVIAPRDITAPRVRKEFDLTAREKEVLSHLIKGMSNKDIARSLNLQVVTVKLHVRGICRKMKAANRTQAALRAIENGWE